MLNAKICILIAPESLSHTEKELDNRDISHQICDVLSLPMFPPERLTPKKSVTLDLLEGNALFKDLESYLRGDSCECILNELSLALGEIEPEFSMSIASSAGHSKWQAIDVSPGGMYQLREHFESINPNVEPFPARGVLINFK